MAKKKRSKIPANIWRSAPAIEQVPPQDSDDPGVILRALPTLAIERMNSTLNEEDMSVEIVITSTEPLIEYDWRRGEYMPTIVLPEGVECQRGQVPLNDTHKTHSINNMLGSVRDISVDGDVLIGRAKYAKGNDMGEKAYNLMREKHLTDYSVGLSPREFTYVEPGETVTVLGRTFTAEDRALRIVNRSELRHVANCSEGYDPNSTTRSNDVVELSTTTTTTRAVEPQNETMQGIAMTKKEYGELIRLRGQDAATMGQQDLARLAQLEQIQREKPYEEAPAPAAAPAAQVVDADEISRNAAAAAIAEERQRVDTIQQVCENLNRSNDAADFIKNGTSIDEVNRLLLERMAANTAPKASISRGTNGSAEDFRRDATQGLLIGRNLSADITGDISRGADNFKYAKIIDIARKCVELSGGGSTSGLSPMETLSRAYATTDFPIIISGVANAQMMAGYEEQEETFRNWADMSGSLDDFSKKEMKDWTAFSTLKEKKEGAEFQELKTGELGESVKLGTFGGVFSLTREAAMSNDLTEIIDIPRALGSAANATLADAAYLALTSNPKMSDNKTLFHTDHGNVGTGGLDFAGYNLADQKIGAQTSRGKNGRPLNLKPTQVLANRALFGAGEQFFAATTLGDDKKPNPFYNAAAREYDARIALNEWYLLCRNAVKFFFLHGNQAPTMDRTEHFMTDTLKWKVRTDFAVKVPKWEKVYKSTIA